MTDEVARGEVPGMCLGSQVSWCEQLAGRMLRGGGGAGKSSRGRSSGEQRKMEL